ncbi:MAG: hypothetical protein RLZZ126_1215 [Pseudomonadota bacterium]|jgi:hypothetical protein
MKTDSERVKRRVWLSGTVSVGVAVAGALALSGRGSAVPQAPAHADDSAATPQATRPGYQLTDHVRRYYATTKV